MIPQKLFSSFSNRSFCLLKLFSIFFNFIDIFSIIPNNLFSVFLVISIETGQIKAFAFSSYADFITGFPFQLCLPLLTGFQGDSFHKLAVQVSRIRLQRWFRNFLLGTPGWTLHNLKIDQWPCKNFQFVLMDVLSSVSLMINPCEAWYAVNDDSWFPFNCYDGNPVPASDS